MLSEVEWKYAALAGVGSKYSWGNGAPERDTKAANGAHIPLPDTSFLFIDKAGAPAPVGSYRANAFGLHDMYGNVEEWLDECYDLRGKYYPTPVPAGVKCYDGVLGGGGWYEPYFEDIRRFSDRKKASRSDANVTFGLRVVRDID